MKILLFSLFVIYAAVTAEVLQPQSGESDLASADGAHFNWHDLQTLLKSSSVQSIESLLPLLPMDLRENFTLVTQSQSRMQEGSLTNPRVVLFGSSGRLLMTFNGDSSQKGFSALEVLSFSEQTKKFELHEIDFSNGQAKISEANPHRCVQCHGENPRPIWSEYRTWKGVMGGVDDNVSDSPEYWLARDVKPEEVENYVEDSYREFNSFRNLALEHPRYRWLGWKKDVPQYPYHYDSDKKSLIDSPNTRLIQLTAINYVRSLSARVSKSPLFPSYKYSLAYGLSCATPEEADQLIQNISVYSPIPAEEHWIESREAWVKDVLSQHAILNLFGIPYGSTSVGLRIDNPGDLRIRLEARELIKQENPVGPQPNRGAFVDMGLDSGLGAKYVKGSNTFMAVQILREIASTDKQIANSLEKFGGWSAYASELSGGSSSDRYDSDSLYRTPVGFANFLNEVQAYVNPKAKKNLCPYLKSRTLAEQKVRHARPSQEQLDAGLHPEWPAGWKILVYGKCISCHDQDGLPEAPKIPFAKPKEFKEYVKFQQSIGLDALADIHKKIKLPPKSYMSGADEPMTEMPLAGAALTEHEQQTLMKYLKQMAGISH